MTSATGTKTILYYTGNRKHPEFEARVRDTLAKNNPGLPIVSVSQRPIHFGENICVGDVGASYLNVYRQIFLGAHAVKTEYIIFAEDDFLYPPEYFAFAPPGGDFYRYDNVWFVLWKGSYHKTYPIGGAQICKTSFVIRELASYLSPHPLWFNGKYRITTPDWNGKPYEMFTGPPAISFKPSNNLSRTGSFGKESTRTLPIWGDIAQLRRRYDFR